MMEICECYGPNGECLAVQRGFKTFAKGVIEKGHTCGEDNASLEINIKIANGQWRGGEQDCEVSCLVVKQWE